MKVWTLHTLIIHDELQREEKNTYYKIRITKICKRCLSMKLLISTLTALKLSSSMYKILISVDNLVCQNNFLLSISQLETV